MDERKAQVFALADAPRRVMRFELGTMMRLVSEENGAKNMDFHINVINVDSDPGPYHYHERAENAYLVLEGTVEVVVEGTRHILRKDDVGFMPPDLSHYHQSVARLECICRIPRAMRNVRTRAQGWNGQLLYEN